MSRIRLTIAANSAALATVFTISRGSKSHAETVIVTLDGDGIRGRGECVPYERYGETIESVKAQIEKVRGDLEAGMDRENLQTTLPAGAARCAIDSAMWDLEATKTGFPVWQLAGLPQPRPLQTAITIALDRPEAMAEAAHNATSSLLKLKLGGSDDLSRLEAVHMVRPDARLILDANEGLAPEDLPGITNAADTLGVVLIEQPLHADNDRVLVRGHSPVPICADESIHTASDIARLARHYDAVNIKLDKAGGLTEAIAMMKAARAENMGVMVGCMVAGSLSMAPAMLLGGLADFIDLDGPLWLAEDIEHGLLYQDGHVEPPIPELWG